MPLKFQHQLIFPTNELLDLFDASADTPTASAFIQQRNKIRPEAFESIFAGFSHKIMTEFTKNMPILAVDGSDVQIPTNPEDLASFYSETNNRFLSALKIPCSNMPPAFET